MNKQKLAYVLMGILTFSTLFAFIFTGHKDNSLFYESSLLQNRDNVQKRASDNDKITNDRKNGITGAVEMVRSAVVGINVTTTKKVRNNMWYQFWFGNQVTQQELGSGVLISPDGYILTNDHVANTEGAANSEILITLTDGTQHKATKIGSDPYSDISLLKISTDIQLPYVKFGNSDDILIGEWVIALGNPFGLFDVNDKPTVTVGVVSATEMNMGMIDSRCYVDMIQTDAAINPGNSGGPLININGELIGLNSLIRGSNEGVQANIGLGFAIPVNKVKRIINELKEKGEIDRNYFTGLERFENNNEQIMRNYNLATSKGVVLVSVTQNSPADKAGLKYLDVIVQVGKYKTSNNETFQAAFFEFRTGDTVPIKILRGKETLTKNMKLERAKK